MKAQNLSAFLLRRTTNLCQTYTGRINQPIVRRSDAPCGPNGRGGCIFSLGDNSVTVNFCSERAFEPQMGKAQRPVVERMTKFELVVNLKSAMALRLVVASLALARATKRLSNE
jgi:hypothetical protein